MIEFLRARKPSLSLDMAPLIDAVFQLLIFFMLTSSFSNPALKIDLPRAKDVDRREPEQIVLGIDKTGNLFLNRAKVEESELKTRLESLLHSEPNKAVHVRGDSEMPYRLFVHVMDVAHEAGVRLLNLVHEAERKP